MEKRRKKITEKFRTQEEFAAAIGISPSGLTRALQNGNWRADKIEAACKALDIEPCEIPRYFFANSIANNANKGVT